ncbi:hypothetical protein WR25_26285 [Diploscapter pachys]|uniref:CNNM transmembrane domain-containing protein n=1 Tax=Diploscapter pachys TaxID=2018661 RepID=A0A2A2LEP5_9BILA|nr:hypothetical protein WR25_26285 [Diploscapter pachys]
MYGMQVFETIDDETPLIALKKDLINSTDEPSFKIRAYGRDAEEITEMFVARSPSCNDQFMKVRVVKRGANSITGQIVDTKIAHGILYLCFKPAVTIMFDYFQMKFADQHVLPFYIVGALLAYILSAMFSGLNIALMSMDVENLHLIKEHDVNRRKREYAESIIPIRKNEHLLLCTIIFDGSLSRHGLLIGSYSRPLVTAFMVFAFPIAWPLSKCLDLIVGRHKNHRLEYREMLANVTKQIPGEQLQRVVRNTMNLDAKVAGDVMTPIQNVTMISERQVLNRQILSTLMAKKHTRIPAKTLCELWTRSSHYRYVVRDTPVSKLIQFGSNLNILKEMKSGFSIALVVDFSQEKSAYSIVGIVTLEDNLEEVIGEIYDEKDLQSREKAQERKSERHKNSITSTRYTLGYNNPKIRLEYKFMSFRERGEKESHKEHKTHHAKRYNRHDKVT